MENLIPAIDDLITTMQEFVDTTSYDDPGDPYAREFDESEVLKGFSGIFKGTSGGAGKAWANRENNALPNENGKSLDLAVYHAKKLALSISDMKKAVAFYGAAGTTPKEYLESNAGKKHLKEASKAYVEYAKHSAAGGLEVTSYEAWTSKHAPEFNDYLNTKLKASIGATKASAKIAQNAALKKFSDPAFHASFLSIKASGTSTDKAKLQQQYDHYEKQYIKNGGSPEDWAVYKSKFLSGTLPAFSGSLNLAAALTPKFAKTSPPEPAKDPVGSLKFKTPKDLDSAVAQHMQLGIQMVNLQKQIDTIPSGISADGKDLGGLYKQAFTQFNKSVDHLTANHSDVSLAAYGLKIKAISAQGGSGPGAPAPQSAGTTKVVPPVSSGAVKNLTFIKPDSSLDAGQKQNHVLNQNLELGVAYYATRAKFGQDGVATKAAYAEWQKSKDYLTSENFYSKTSISELSSKAKTQYQQDADKVSNAESQVKAAAAKVNQDKIKAKQKAAESVKASAAILSQFENHPIQKVSTEALTKALNTAKEKAKLAGWTDESIDNFLTYGKGEGAAALAKEKAGALANVQTTAYSSGMKKATAPKEEYAAAKKEFDEAKKDAIAFGYTPSAIADMALKGTTTAVSQAKRLKKLQTLMGEAGAKAAIVYSDFKPIQFSDTPGTFSHNSAVLSAGGTQVEKAHVAWSQAQYGKLTPTEKVSLLSHLGGGYSEMNKGGDPKTKSSVEEGLRKTTLGTDMNLRRNIAQRWLFQGLGVPEAEWAQPGKLSDATLASLVGRTYTETATMSTTKALTSTISYQSEAAKSGVASLFIRAHKNVNGFDTNLGTGSSVSESEVTLAPNQTMVITKIEKTANTGLGPRYNVYVDMIGYLGSAKGALS